MMDVIIKALFWTPNSTKILCLGNLICSVHFGTFSEVSPHLSRWFSCIKSFSWSLSVDLAENRQKERRSLPRTCGHKVSFIHLRPHAAESSFINCVIVRNDSIIWLRWSCMCPTCLCTGHEVSLWLDNRNGIFLDRGWSGVATQGNVAHDDLTQVHILELHSAHTQSENTPRNDAADKQRNMDGSLVNNSSLHSRCGEGSCVRWPQQECRRISQS